MVGKYVTCGQSDDNIDHVNAWYRKCQHESVPYVTVSTRTKYADVQWDYINLPNEIVDVIRGKGDEFVKGFIGIFKKYANQKSEYRAGSFVVEFTNIEVERAQPLAEEIYDYVLRELRLPGPT